MKLIRIDLLRHIEAHSPKRVANMTSKMLQSGIWEKPICVEQNHYLVLDGQHRLEVAIDLGLRYVPCELFDYKDDSLLVWSLRKDCIVSKELVIKRALSGNIYPYKTAKHKFPHKVEKVKISLQCLYTYSKANSEDIIEYEPKVLRTVE